MPEEQVNHSASQTLDDAEAQTRRTIERIIWIGALGAAVLVVVNLMLYFQTRAWQMLIVAGGELLAFLGLIVTIRNIQTIRTRLIVSFVAVVILPAFAITFTAGANSLQSNKEQAIRQLNSVVAFKESEINSWLQTLSNNLVMVLSDQDESSVVAVTTSPLGSTVFQNAYQQLMARFTQVWQQTSVFEELFILDTQGQVVISTDPKQEKLVKSDREYFQKGLQGRFTTAPFLSPTLGKMTMVSVCPLTDHNGQTVGVLAGRADIVTLQRLMSERLETTDLSTKSETYLVAQDYSLLTPSRYPKYVVGSKIPVSDGVRKALEEHPVVGSASYTNYAGQPVIGVFRWLPELGAALMAEREQSDVYGGIYQILFSIGGIALGSLALAIALSLFLTQTIANPLTDLAHAAEQVAAGDLMLRVTVNRQDEIGALAKSFNGMTAQLRGLIGRLEQQAAERTAQLNASAQVGQAASSTLDVPALLRTVVNLITDRFGCYYAAVFTLDETGRFAVLQEATGEAGRVLKEQGHRLQVGTGSMVGTAISTLRPRIALHAEEERERLIDPLLPETRSEIAVPLRLGDRVIGALDVQSAQPNAFDETIAATLQSMADQIAVALGNARLHTEVQQRARQQEGLARIAALLGSTLAIDELIDRLLIEAKQLFDAKVAVVLLKDEREAALVGRHVAEDASGPAPETWHIPLDAPGFEKSIFARGGTYICNKGLDDPNIIPAYRPYMEALNIHNFCGVALRVRDASLGELYVGNRSGDFGGDDVSLLRTIAGYTANTIQNARLFEETQRSATREQLINTMAARIRSSLALEDVLQATVQEIGQRMDAARVSVRLKLPGADGKVKTATNKQTDRSERASGIG